MNSGLLIKIVAVLSAAVIAVAAVVIIYGNDEDKHGDVQDAFGNEVKFTSVPETIISTSPAVTDTLCAMGYADKIVMLSNSCDNPAVSDIEDKRGTGSYSRPSTESIAGEDADVVFIDMANGTNVNTVTCYNQLNAAGIRAVLLYGPDSGDLSSVFNNITIIGVVMGETEKAGSIIDSIMSDLERMKSVSDSKVRALAGFNFGSMAANGADVYFSGSNTTLNDLMTNYCSIENVASEVDGWKKVSVDVIELNYNSADLLFVLNSNMSSSTVAEIDAKLTAAGCAFSSMNAVPDGTICFYDRIASLAQRTSPDTIIAGKIMALYAHPDAFGITLGDLPRYVDDTNLDTLLSQYWA